MRIDSAKEELFNLRFQLATGQLDNTARLKDLRHDVARDRDGASRAAIEAELEAELARVEAAMEQERHEQAADDEAEEDEA